MTRLGLWCAVQVEHPLTTSAGRCEKLKISHIIYCEADENYTKIYTIRGDFILVSRTLKVIEEMLPPDYFFRIHKSHLINMNFVKSYNRTDGYKILLENGVELEIATRRNEEFVKALTKAKG